MKNGFQSSRYNFLMKSDFHSLKRPKLSSKWKHLLHCLVMFMFIVFFTRKYTQITAPSKSEMVYDYDLFKIYGKYAILLYIPRIIALLQLPYCCFVFLGLLLYDAFQEKVSLKYHPSQAPFLCFRIVTKGYYPDLVRQNVRKNLEICSSVGLKKFVIEVVTEKIIDILPEHPKIRQVVVPQNYHSRRGTLFKARVLQYSLEKKVNILNDEDYIVHLDEETLLTKNSVCGIINFTTDGQHPFGQGVITLASGKIVNWITTLSDSPLVADDVGKIQSQFRLFHRPLFGWKGSYMVARLDAERFVSFDHGPDGSVSEDIFFSMKAFEKGYSFDFIEGEMQEKSPFTISDLLRQRERFIRGLLLVTHSPDIPLKYKLLPGTFLCTLLTLPLVVFDCILSLSFPSLNKSLLTVNISLGFVRAITIYMNVFGVAKSFSLKELSGSEFCFAVVGVLLLLPFNMITALISSFRVLVDRKPDFFIVQK